MKIEFDNWFGRKIDDTELKMYAGSIIPTIEFVIQKDFYSFTLVVFFWSINIEYSK